MNANFESAQNCFVFGAGPKILQIAILSDQRKIKKPVRSAAKCSSPFPKMCKPYIILSSKNSHGLYSSENY